MVMFESEAELLEVLLRHDNIVRQCIQGEVSLKQFCEKYNNFYTCYALDGHESDEEERALMMRHENRIYPHRIIASDSLGQVCSDEDAKKVIYKQMGRFGSAEAVARLGRVAIPSAS